MVDIDNLICAKKRKLYKLKNIEEYKEYIKEINNELIEFANKSCDLLLDDKFIELVNKFCIDYKEHGPFYLEKELFFIIEDYYKNIRGLKRLFARQDHIKHPQKSYYRFYYSEPDLKEIFIDLNN